MKLLPPREELKEARKALVQTLCIIPVGIALIILNTLLITKELYVQGVAFLQIMLMAEDCLPRTCDYALSIAIVTTNSIPYLIALVMPFVACATIRKAPQAWRTAWNQALLAPFSSFAPGSKRLTVAIGCFFVIMRIVCLALYLSASGEWMASVEEWSNSLYIIAPLPQAWSVPLYLLDTVAFYLSYRLLFCTKLRFELDKIDDRQRNQARNQH